jgi:hypothetical protein
VGTKLTRERSDHYCDGYWKAVRDDGLEITISTELQPDGEWSAVDAENYEAESDSVGHWSKSPVGYGRSENDAVMDLLEQIEERANARPRKLERSK